MEDEEEPGCDSRQSLENSRFSGVPQGNRESTWLLTCALHKDKRRGLSHFQSCSSLANGGLVEQWEITTWQLCFVCSLCFWQNHSGSQRAVIKTGLRFGPSEAKALWSWWWGALTWKACMRRPGQSNRWVHYHILWKLYWSTVCPASSSAGQACFPAGHWETEDPVLLLCFSLQLPACVGEAVFSSDLKTWQKFTQCLNL